MRTSRASDAAIAAVLALALAGSPGRADESTPASTLVAQAWPDSDASPWRARTPAAAPRSTSVHIAAGSASITGAASQIDGRAAYAGRTMGSLRLDLAPRLSAEVRAGLSTLDRGADFERRTTRTLARLRVGDGERNAWLGVAFEHSLSGTPLPTSPSLALGLATRAREVVLSAGIEQTVERVRFSTRLRPAVPGDTLNAPAITMFDTRLSKSTSALISGRWAFQRLTIESVAGLTLNRLTAPYRWTQTSATIAIKPRVSVFATLGNPAPRWLALDAGFERRASLGVRLTSWTNPAAGNPDAGVPALPGWRLRRLGQDWQVIEIRAPGAGRVEVMGDFTGWKPLALRHVHRDRWAIAVRMEPGVHQIEVRLEDGPWMPPAGLPVTSDAFSGSVGVFVAE
jgi:hypothetical protein